MGAFRITGFNLNNPFISLKHRNFRYYMFGMFISSLGSGMQNIAQPWLAYKLTNSPLLLSVVGALQFAPILFFSLFAGVLIDKFPKKNIIIVTQSASLLVTLSLAILIWTGKVQYWHILLTATALGFVNTLDMPTRQSFIIELVGKEDRMNAIALNATFLNLSIILGPAIAGIVMGYSSISTCFFANSMSFGVVLISFFFIKPIVIQKEFKKSEKVFINIKEGLKYIYSNKKLLNSLLVLAVVATFSANFNVLVPVFSTLILKQDGTGFGLLMAFMGVGSCFGAILIAMKSKTEPKKFVLYIAPLIVGASFIITGFTNAFLFTGISLATTGFFYVMFISSTNSQLQLNSSNEYIGRVMSLYALILGGLRPFGNLYAGYITDRFNARVGFVACGAIIIVLMIPIFVRLFKIDRYRKKL